MGCLTSDVFPWLSPFGLTTSTKSLGLATLWMTSVRSLRVPKVGTVTHVSKAANPKGLSCIYTSEELIWPYPNRGFCFNNADSANVKFPGCNFQVPTISQSDI